MFSKMSFEFGALAGARLHFQQDYPYIPPKFLFLLQKSRLYTLSKTMDLILSLSTYYAIKKQPMTMATTPKPKECLETAALSSSSVLLLVGATVGACVLPSGLAVDGGSVFSGASVSLSDGGSLI